MKRFIILVFASCIPNLFVVWALSYVLYLKMSRIDIIAWTFVTSLIGISLATAIRYAIRAAKDHEA